MTTVNRRNGKPGRRRTDSVVDRLAAVETAVSTMSEVLDTLTKDLRSFRRETQVLRRAERFTSLASLFLAKLGRCLRRNIDRAWLSLKWLFVRLVLPGALVTGAWNAYKHGVLTEWLSKFWP